MKKKSQISHRSTKLIPVEIPEIWLLTLAVHGDMGSGEISDAMRQWARNVCNANGLSEIFKQEQKLALAETVKRFKSIIGEEQGNKILEQVQNSVTKIESALDQ